MNLVFLINLLLLSSILMATVGLIILREKLDTRVMMAGLFIEAMFSLASMLFLNPDQLGNSYLVLRIFGRACEAMTLWGAITMQVRGFYVKSAESAGDQPVKYWQERFDRLETIIHEMKGDKDDVAH